MFFSCSFCFQSLSMHFIKEACSKRSLESKTLTYSRGATSILMGFLFVAYCAYLISQMYNNQPLLQISSEYIGHDSATPDIELCAQNSSLTVIKCTAMYYNWTTQDIPNCWETLFRPGVNDLATKCYVFESNGTLRMSRGVTYDSSDALRKIDFYWKFDALFNMTYTSISIPAISIQLYSPTFSSWKRDIIGNTEIEGNMMNNIASGGAYIATSFVNYTTTIFYHPQKYRAIRPNDISTLFGFSSNFIDIITLTTNSFSWPIQLDPPTLITDRRLYDGAFSVKLDQDTFEVKTEIMQHSIVSSIALAGGCYSVLTTIYVILFGMAKLSPWGIVHRIPTCINKHPPPEYYPNSTMYTHTQHQNEKARSSIFGLLSWVSSTKNNAVVQVTRSQLERLKVDDSSAEAICLTSLTGLLPPQTDNKGEESSTPFQEDHKTASQQESDEVNKLKRETLVLSQRMEELEFMLSEYFINTKYLDQLRNRKTTSTLGDPEVMVD
ncbi:uncharacterized protein EV154DRAFT_519251 [Mucor mucedo]|uniref:uncharacterized protein n=1 Tax=Mucor mucedo TaxID=29922 RepID=UPI002220C40E|nr:uncharacterized protein EV154DRAFT_519251 [Mucor mucedo]KAI7887985.1 hypothetical protein EV154DRAFT_519251 [Mucor mucedo]